jgi:thymidylate kinase
MKKGLLIAFEGIRGSGLTSQINNLHYRIKNNYTHQDILTTMNLGKTRELKKN